MSFELRTRDAGGHSGRPTDHNAIYRLAAALLRVEKLVFPVRRDGVTRRYFEALARIEQGEVAHAAAVLSAQPAFNATLRSTCTATTIHGGQAVNGLPQEARAIVKCRALPGQTQAEIERALVAAVDDAKVEVVAMNPRASAPPTPIDADFLAAVTRISELLWPGVPVVPILGTGATDSTFFRLAGIPAYGVSGLFDDIDDYRAHGRDERLGVRQFYDGLRCLRKLVRTLAVARDRHWAVPGLWWSTALVARREQPGAARRTSPTPAQSTLAIVVTNVCHRRTARVQADSSRMTEAVPGNGR